ncbi:MAG: sugar ABC transporter substrate-binding protein, partial [Arcobacteraceae bacterium]
MKKILKIVFSIVICLNALYLNAAETKNSSVGKESPYVIISIRTDANEFMRALVDGAKIFAKSIGSEDKVIALFNYGNSEKQMQDLRLTLEKIGSNAILFMDANDEKDLVFLVNIAKEYGIYFSTVFNKPPDIWPWDFGKYWVTHTIPDAVLSGKVTAQEIVKQINGKGNLLVLQGIINNSTNKMRLEGLHKVLKNYPDIKILDSKVANWSRAESSMLVTQWFTKYTTDDVQAIWAGNDEMALGAIEVLKEMGVEKKIAVSGVDGTEESARSVILEELNCTVSTYPYWQSGMGLSFAYQAYLGNIDPLKLTHQERAFYTKTRLLTRDNVQDFLENNILNFPKIDYSKLWEGKYSRPM